MNVFRLLAWLIVILGSVNLIRITLYMTGADWHDVKHAKRKRSLAQLKPYRPLITVIVPAHNEERVILRNLESIFANDYGRKEVYLIDDGSTDSTVAIARAYKRKFKLGNLHIYHKPNGGKATAINRGLQLARGSLIMVLDADSSLHPKALGELPDYYRDKRVLSAAANVKIIEDGGLFNLVQKFEYLICYRMKRAQTVYNVEYIIGGIGSSFRKAAALKVGGFDSDTVTEDIDFTLKLIRNDNTNNRVIYAPSVITYTESVMSFSQLIRQRFRWKYGRTQTFLKNKHMFLNPSRKLDWRLTWVQLPFTLFSEFTFLLEPLLLAFIILITLWYHDFITLTSAYLIMTLYLALNVIAEETETWQSKLRLLPLALVQYPLMFGLMAVEYAASVQTLVHIPRLLRQDDSGNKWQHVERSGKAVNASHKAV